MSKKIIFLLTFIKIAISKFYEKPKIQLSNFRFLGVGGAYPCHTDKLCLSSVLDIETIFQAKKEVQGDMSYAIVRNEK